MGSLFWKNVCLEFTNCFLDTKAGKRKREDETPKRIGRPPKRPKTVVAYVDVPPFPEAGPSSDHLPPQSPPPPIQDSPQDPPKRKRGRPKKNPPPEPEENNVGEASQDLPKRKRGRPRKNLLPTESDTGEAPDAAASVQELEPASNLPEPSAVPIVQDDPVVHEPSQTTTEPATASVAPRRRGRPRKRVKVEDNNLNLDVEENLAPAPEPAVEEQEVPPQATNESVVEATAPARAPSEPPPQDIPIVEVPPSKETSGARSHNLSHLRRRNEFMTLVREADVVLDFFGKPLR